MFSPSAPTATARTTGATLRRYRHVGLDPTLGWPRSTEPSAATSSPHTVSTERRPMRSVDHVV
jgi:hypothetical protein